MTNYGLFKTAGNVPVIVNSSINNGIGGYVDLNPTESGNMITYSDTTTSDAILIKMVKLHIIIWLQQKDINGKGEYFINSGIENNGIKGRTDKKAKIFDENTITIDFWGIANYRSFKYKMATHNHVFSLSGKVIKNEKVGLYLVSQMQYLRKIFNYNNMGTWNKMKKLKIELPINNKEEIDFNYIEKYITALEKLTIKDVIIWKDNISNANKENK